MVMGPNKENITQGARGDDYGRRAGVRPCHADICKRNIAWTIVPHG
jgi:hypothetical protein